MSNWLKDFEKAFQNAIICYYLTDVQEKYSLDDEEMFSMIYSNYEGDKVKELLGDD